jgi:hypothetical protein
LPSYSNRVEAFNQNQLPHSCYHFVPCEPPSPV